MSETKATIHFGTLRAANRHRQAEWDKDARIGLSYRGNELAGETGEACNIMKKLERERLGIRGSRATVEDLSQELADVIICCDLIAMGEGIDLEEAVAAKFNLTSEKVGLATRLSPVKLSRAITALRNLQHGAALALEKVPDGGVVSDFLAAIHRECVGGLIASDAVRNDCDGTIADDDGRSRGTDQIEARVILDGRALNDVAEEVLRQVHVEGFDAEHDDQYRGGQLALAGAAYAICAAVQTVEGPTNTITHLPLRLWPWSIAWWKPKDLRRNLVRAAALIIAQIRAFDRAEARKGEA